MGLTLSVNKNNFEDMQRFINNKNITIINTLDLNQQQCLIQNTISADKETDHINKLIKTNLAKAIVIYGKNCNDENVITKYKQLKELGFKNLSIYIGGLFEWLLLQDIYGDDLFPTTSKETDFLKYKSPSLLT